MCVIEEQQSADPGVGDVASGARQCVVLIHGIWLTGLELWPLARRLRAAGYAVRIFHYPSLRRSPAQNADALQRWLAKIDQPVVHLIGYSLGGLVLLNLLARHPAQRPGRLLLLGSPVHGSGVAARLARQRWSRPLLGRALPGGLDGSAPHPAVGRSVGVIAGDRPGGVGTLVGGLHGANDGTVSVAETRLPGAAHCVLPLGHIGLILSPRALPAILAFLRSGKF